MMVEVLNRGVKSAGYMRYQIANKTLKQMQELALDNPKQLAKLIEEALSIREIHRIEKE
jgi:hypothetical protein